MLKRAGTQGGDVLFSEECRPPKGWGPQGVRSSLQPGTAYPSEKSALGPGMTVAGSKSPLSMEVGLGPEGKDDLQERESLHGNISHGAGAQSGLRRRFPM